MPELITLVRDWASIDVLLLAAWVLWVEARRWLGRQR